MRVLGLDVGERRIGVAISDELGITASGLSTIDVTDPAETIEELVDIIREYDVDEVVVGLPLRLDGSLGIQAEKISCFVEGLKEKTGVPVRFVDERFSTKLAERILLTGNVSRAKRRKVIDKLSAVIILQDYLNS